ncbi:transcription cofactor HES-6 [Corythoichthys intestinalis]|uniref:transcription cofactor HES-6 n=1 Tax=Corythoichthys intestinalis TaxID=161448 RepID=UPI0025A55535|nr:transcription cofactor HES-6 [Corythoichthys intestinalis]XP_061795465.1 transcription cofactor HES-6-like [Nerophis lumbriciformis]
MAPARKHTPTDHCTRGLKSDRKMRKPLVEKKRRARINDSLHELRALMADTELQSKMENAEVLEMTVRRVESILQNRAQDVSIRHDARERFAAGYIQCMHDVHTFVSSFPGLDPDVGAELLNHLLESMPFHGQERLRTTPMDTDPCGGPRSPPLAPSGPLVSPAASCVSSDDFVSDLDDTDLEQSQVSPAKESEQSQVFSSEESELQDGGSSSEESELQDVPPGFGAFTSIWRPW